MQPTGPVKSVGRATAGRLACCLPLALLAGVSAAFATPNAAGAGHLGAAGTAHRHPLAPARLRSIALDEGGARATLTLRLSAPVRPRLLRLHRPERLVIDLPHTQNQAQLPIVAPMSLVTTLRSGSARGNSLRLVLELGASRLVSLRHEARAGGGEYQWRVLLGGVPASTLGTAVPSTLVPAPQAARQFAWQRAPQPAAMNHLSAPSLSGAAAGEVATTHAPRGEHEVVVVIDPGHGGDDPGASGQDGIHEKDLTLAIARVLAARIDREPGMRAVLTRTGDYFITLSERLERARKAHADFLVSIHADSVRDPSISGASAYVLSERGASSEAARKLAAEENAADLKGGVPLAAEAPELRSVLLDVSQNEFVGQSAEAARDVLGALAGVGSVRKREVQRAAFVVLKSPYIPSLLVETAYISNRADEQRLESPDAQQRLADAIFAGIVNYFRQYPPPGSLFAHAPARAVPASS